jgi:hypothetical protein
MEPKVSYLKVRHLCKDAQRTRVRCPSVVHETGSCPVALGTSVIGGSQARGNNGPKAVKPPSQILPELNVQARIISTHPFLPLSPSVVLANAAFLCYEPDSFMLSYPLHDLTIRGEFCK